MAETPAKPRNTCTPWIITPLMMYPSEIWATWILSTLWVLQMFLMTDAIIIIGILIFEVEGQGSEVDVGWIVCLAFMFICILLTAAEIGLSFAHALHPWTFLGTQIFKSTFWLIYFAAGMATTVAQRVIDYDLVWTAWRYWQAVGISLAFAVTIAALIYGAVVVHKYRRSGMVGQMQMGEKELGRQEEAQMGDVPVPAR